MSRFDRRTLLRASALGAGALLAPAGLAGAKPRLLDDHDRPTTGFEDRDGASWTTHEEELEFLDAVAAVSPRVSITEIARSNQDRPLHLVAIGDPAPPTAGRSRVLPSVLFVCTQHGNEPAGREAGLKLIRDLALTDDPVLVRQLREQAVLVVPTANPDGRARNIRSNGVTDINRDHLGLTQPETQGIHEVIRDWSPDLILDLHEYGPSVPVLYDADVLYLWPRNLNVDPQVRDLSRTLCTEYIRKGAESAGYTADEYGLYKVGPNEVTQTAGNEDEGICRNAVGLRHSLGILIESAVSQSVTLGRGVDEVTSTAANQRRRVDSQVQTTVDALRFMRDQGDLAKYASDGAPARAARNDRPVYWRGADNDPPSSGDITDPPPSAYELSPTAAARLDRTFALHGIDALPSGGVVTVPMTQAARPVIPLLLDARGRRHVEQGTPVD